MGNVLKTGVTRAKELAFALWSEVSETAVAVFNFPVDVVTLCGRPHGWAMGDDITLLYVGRRANLAHFKNKYFETCSVVTSHRANLLTYRKYMSAAEASVDIKIIDIGWPYHGTINRKGDYLVLPDWVFLSAPLAKTWDGTVQNFRKTMRKNIARLIRKNGYQCEATNDPAEIEAFYDNYYDAFIKSRHNDEVVMTPRIIMEQRAREGTILKVVGPDGPVAAGVYFPLGEALCLLASGMPEKLLKAPPQAAIAALYYFSLKYAFDNGYKALNFFGTRAFPDDGLFQFKRKFGSVIKDEFSINSILFRPMNTAKAAKFCAQFPLIARVGKTKNLQMVLCTLDTAPRPDDIARLIDTYGCEGLHAVKVVHISDSPEKTAPLEIPQATIVRTTSCSFAKSLMGGETA